MYGIIVILTDKFSLVVSHFGMRSFFGVDKYLYLVLCSMYLYI